MKSPCTHDHTRTLCAQAHCHQQHICIINGAGINSTARCVQVLPKISMSGLSLCCRWLHPIPASLTLTSVLAGPTPHVSALATEGTRYSHIPRQPMIPLYCLLLLTHGQNPGGLSAKKAVAAQAWSEPAACCSLLLLAARCSVHATAAPNVCKACDNDSWNQSWQQLLCKAVTRLHLTAMLTTTSAHGDLLVTCQAMLLNCDPASMCSWWQHIIVIKPMPLM